MTRARWIIFAAVCLVLLGFLVVSSKKDAVDVSKLNTSAVITEGDGTDHVFGNKNAKVVLIEYGDFQCPGCGGAYSKIKSIKETYKDQVAFVFRNMPLTTIHPNALAAASAAGAAARQGKFWEMHDKLYENQSSWENLSANQRNAAFEGYAKDLNLNVDQFKEDMTGSEVRAKIAVDRAIAAKVQVTSTPTFYIGSDKMADNIVTNVVQDDGKLLKEKLDAAIKSTGGTPPAAAQQ